MLYEVAKHIGNFGITIDDGQTVYDVIHPALKANDNVVLDFANVRIVATPFLNAAIGQLLRDLEPDDLNKYLKIENLSPISRPILKRVIENSKRYYSDPAWQDIVNKVIQQEAGLTDAD